VSSGCAPLHPLKHLVKDLRLAEAGLDSPIHPLYDSYEAAQKRGFGDEDVMAIITSLRNRNLFPSIIKSGSLRQQIKSTITVNK
jgi:hypothetical protein